MSDLKGPHVMTHKQLNTILIVSLMSTFFSPSSRLLDGMCESFTEMDGVRGGGGGGVLMYYVPLHHQEDMQNFQGCSRGVFLPSSRG